MGGRAQEPKLPEMGTPAPLRRRKEREFGRRGALDDPGTGLSLLTKCDTSRVDVVANDCPEPWGTRGEVLTAWLLISSLGRFPSLLQTQGDRHGL